MAQLLLAALCAMASLSHAFVSPTTTSSASFATTTRSSHHHQHSRTKTTQVEALPAAVASLLAGSIAGTIGVGVAFPLDTIKTKAQVLATSPPQQPGRTSSTHRNTNQEQDKNNLQEPQLVVGADGSAVARLVSSSSVRTTRPIDSNSNMLQVAQYIFETEGVGGFYGGVQTSMMGQAIIKAVVFASNAVILDACRQTHAFGDQTAVQLLFAAAAAGFITAFISAPVDRIKVLMQAAGQDYKGKEDVCLKSVLRTEGWKGLMGRGLACTMIREVPAYSLYFGVYGGLQQWTPVADHLGPLAPLIFGAIAGMACWIPIYPIDVVKTVIQNTRGEDKEKTPWQVTAELYDTHGPSVFYDGIAPRLLRQAVNHAVTFGIYDALYHNVLT